MKINTYRFLEGARQARGVAVIIDVFRAFSLECYLTANNAAQIIPVASKEVANQLKRQNPKYVLMGERGGVKLPGYDYGNSPSEVIHTDFAGKTIIHTTSAGTQGLENAMRADVVLTGSLVNSKAIAAYILQEGFEEVSLVAMGLNASSPAPEDEFCARYIQNLLEGRETNLAYEISKIKRHPEGAKFFNLRIPQFPQKDFAFCTDVDKFDFVLRVDRGADGLLRSGKIEIDVSILSEVLATV